MCSFLCSCARFPLAVVAAFVALLTLTAEAQTPFVSSTQLRHTHGNYTGMGANRGALTVGNPTFVVVRTLAELRREAALDNRFITFNVPSGVMYVTGGPIQVRGKNITISGWEGNAPGITFMPRFGETERFAIFVVEGAELPDGTIRYAENIVLTNLRIRNATDDGVRVSRYARKVALDHLSVAYDETRSALGDGNIDIVDGASGVTVSWSIVGPSTIAKNMLLDRAQNVTLYRNLIVGSANRNPQAQGGSRVDIVNNVIIGWQAGDGIRIKDRSRVNIVKNYFNASVTSPNDNCQSIYILDAVSRRSVFADGNYNPRVDSACINDQGVARSGSVNVPQTNAEGAACEVYDYAGARSGASVLTSGALDSLDAFTQSRATIPRCIVRPRPLPPRSR